jgi:hypothetical protein
MRLPGASFLGYTTAHTLLACRGHFTDYLLPRPFLVELSILPKPTATLVIECVYYSLA